MKVLALPIEMVSYTDNNGAIKPIRFRMQVNDEPMKVIKIDKSYNKGYWKICRQYYDCI